MNLNQRIAARLQSERELRGWSMDTLADRSGVSRAMISKIERNTTQPSAALLARLADALGITFSSFMSEEDASRHRVHRRDEQLSWKDPKTGYLRRMLSPTGSSTDIEIIEITLPARAEVAFAAETRQRHDQQVLLLAGSLNVTVGSEELSLATGDCLRLAVDVPHRFHNPARAAARYLIVTRRV